MRLGLILAGAIAVGLTVVAGGDSRAAAPTARQTLLLEGTVTSIRSTDHRLTPWLVTVAVTKVISGEFAGSTFQFAVHSPARAGLEEGHSYFIEAVWKDGGYTIDENQWRRPRRLGIDSSPWAPDNRALQRTTTLPRFARAGARR